MHMKLKFIVTGMTCAACSARVEKVSKAVAGVNNVEVNLTNHSNIEESIPKNLSMFRK